MISNKDTQNFDLLPAKKDIQTTYESYGSVLSVIKENIELILRNTIQLSSMPTYKSRIKSFSSYYRKLMRQRPEKAITSKSLVSLTDIIGIRIICAFLEDLSVVEQQIKENFTVKEIEDKGATQNFREFGYQSVHVLISIPDECIPPQCREKNGHAEFPLPDDMVCEIQIRTILQDAWAEVEHELIYKSEFSPFDMPLRRKLASINASLSLADIIFQEIRDYQKKFQGEVEKRRESFYHQVDGLTRTIVPVREIAEEPKIQRISPYVRGTIDDMLLEGIHAHNSGDLDKAISIYTTIIKSDPELQAAVLTVIYKHRGMAYFAQNKYDEALTDFSKSVQYDSCNFRAIYYEGIVLNIKNKYRDAIDCFTKSLEINEFQSHAHFHRAVAYYRINEYEEALKDLTAAEKLGLKDAECDALHEKLVGKLDMGI